MARTINGTEFTSNVEQIYKMSDLDQLSPYTIVSINDKPTKYNSYIITVCNEDTDEVLKVYMKEYIVKQAAVGKRFVYNGLLPKHNGNGKYHSVLWAKE